MKARAALSQNDWQVARDAAKAVMDLGVYELWDSGNTGRYKELFWSATDASCKETILKTSIPCKTSQTGISLVGKHFQLRDGVVLTLHKALLMLSKISTEHPSASLLSTTQQILSLIETHVWR